MRSLENSFVSFSVNDFKGSFTDWSGNPYSMDEIVGNEEWCDRNYDF